MRLPVRHSLLRQAMLWAMPVLPNSLLAPARWAAMLG
jgi:hypothetical protein